MGDFQGILVILIRVVCPRNEWDWLWFRLTLLVVAVVYYDEYLSKFER